MNWQRKSWKVTRDIIGRKILISFLMICIMSSGYAQSSSAFTIMFTELSTNDGFVLVLVKDAQDKDVSKLVLPILNKSAEATIRVKPGKYAVVAFHDVNGNEELDKNMLGIPTEPYGFSNNARGMLGPPDLAEQLVDVTKSRMISFKLE